MLQNTYLSNEVGYSNLNVPSGDYKGRRDEVFRLLLLVGVILNRLLRVFICPFCLSCTFLLPEVFYDGNVSMGPAIHYEVRSFRDTYKVVH